MINIIGFYQTKFGELWEQSLSSLIKEAVIGCLNSISIEKERIEAIFFSNMLAGILENNLHLGARLSEILNVNLPIFRVEAACASGGMAVHLAKNYLEAKQAKTVLVVGAEKMTDYSPEETTTALASAASGEEQEAGLTFPGLYALMANYYLNKYHYQEKDLAYISVKNHYHASFNPKAHFKNKITIDDVLQSSYVAYPLKVLDSSPISDGAASLILTTDEELVKKTKNKAILLASEVATDSLSLNKRRFLDRILATEIAGKKAFKKAGIKPEEINIAEVHDCFSIAEILAMEDLGFWKKGQGGEIARTQSTMLGQEKNLVVNTSGGLKASGHPVGATGIKQIGELFLQLTGQAGKRQVKNPQYGLAHNVGGSGGTAVVSILKAV